MTDFVSQELKNPHKYEAVLIDLNHTVIFGVRHSSS